MPRLEPETGETDTGGGGKKHFPGFFFFKAMIKWDPIQFVYLLDVNVVDNC
jgi:hypothetical protein